SSRYYHNHKVGEIISRMMNDVESTKSLVETGMMNIWLDMFSLSFALAIMFYMDFWLAVISIVVFPFYMIAVKILYKRLKLLSKKRSQSLADMQSYLYERVNGIPVIKSFTLETHEQENFDRKNKTFLEKALALTRWNALTNSIINTLTDIAPLIVIGYGGYQVIQGNLTVGSFVAFFGYLDRLYGPLRRLVNSSTELTQASASLDRVMELYNEPYDIVDSIDAITAKSAEGKIEFDHVWFRYEEKSEWILRDIQLAIQPGQTVALVGMSGGGKSSLISLIPRFFDVQQGKIMIDDIDIRSMTIRSLRSQIGMVMQDNILFSGSVKENILFGDPNANNNKIIIAAT
ncbi:MAG: ABC transporter ATP-binding protein, partial [Bacilli bacterium]